MNKLKTIKIIPVFILSLFFAGNALAQPEGGKDRKAHEKKIEQLKISFITNELDLTSEEAQAFWPVYNEMSSKIKVEKKLQHETVKELKNNHDSFSDSDFKKSITAIFDSEGREVQVKKEYTDKIGDIIGYKKAAKLLSLEQRFKRELLSKLNRHPEHKPDHRPDRRPGGPREPAPNRHE